MKQQLTMISFGKFKRICSFLFIGCCIQLIVMFMLVDHQASFRHHLMARHETKREVRGSTYHVHKVDPMRIDLKERYESRRLLVQQNKPRFMSRSEILADYRTETMEASPTEASGGTERFISLRGDGSDMQMRCDTCALVSNSGHMIYSRVGDQIDSAQCVFRLNAAPTFSHELDVGRRTTARIIGTRSFAEVVANSSSLLDKRPTAHNLIFHGPDYQFETGSLPGLLEKVAKKNPQIGLHRVGKSMQYEADEEFKKHTGKSRISGGSELSTGFYALMVMKDVCSSIKVYGMTPEGYCRDGTDDLVPYSYFKNPSLSECLVYDYHENAVLGGQKLSTERRVFKVWAEERDITFSNPSWD